MSFVAGLETASFTGQSEDEINRLMHMVVVGGGPTGGEYAGELHDFLIVRGRCGSDAILNAYLSTIPGRSPKVVP